MAAVQYRRDIDGLRALAVLPVIFFHGGFTWASGGFVGVDVFFVISGYLITSIILSEQDVGRFSFLGFYERRVRRIIPALFFVVSISLPFCWFWLLPDQLEGFSKSLLSVLTFSSNYYFRSTVGYFAPASEEMPLLHTWSLAVEEQFYVLFPLLVISLCKRRAVRFLPYILVLIALISFGYALLSLGGRGAEKVFFDTRARIWELLSGALVACFLNRGCRLVESYMVRQVLAGIGLAMILYAIVFLDRQSLFPGAPALFPVLGAMLIIVFSSEENYVGRLLGSRPFVGMGLLSYSAYLWHQPLFAFARVKSPQEPGEALMIALVVLAIALSYLTWRFVEAPFRNKRWVERPALFGVAGGALFCLAMVGGTVFYQKGVPARFSEADADLLISQAERSAYVSRLHDAYVDKPWPLGSGHKRLLVVGDSFSQDLVNMIHEIGSFSGYDIRAVYVPRRCQIYLGEEDVSRFRAESDRRTCRVDFSAKIADLSASSDVVLLTSSWQEWAAHRLPNTLKSLDLPAGAKVVVVGRKSFGHVNRAAYVGLSLAERAAIAQPLPKEHLLVNELMRNTLSPEVFIDLYAMLCNEPEGTCHPFTPDGKLISYDGSHLTQEGARYVGARLFQHPLMRAYLGG